MRPQKCAAGGSAMWFKVLGPLIMLGSVIATIWKRRRKQPTRPIVNPETRPAQNAIVLRPLLDPDWRVRLAAVQSIYVSPEPRHLDDLELAINDEDAEVRETAGAVLVVLGARSLPVLERALQSERYETRIQAARTLRELAHPDSTEALAEALLREHSRWIRVPAAEALARIGTPAALEALRPLLTEEDEELRGIAQQALGALHLH